MVENNDKIFGKLISDKFSHQQVVLIYENVISENNIEFILIKNLYILFKQLGISKFLIWFLVGHTFTQPLKIGQIALDNLIYWGIKNQFLLGRNIFPFLNLRVMK